MFFMKYTEKQYLGVICYYSSPSIIHNYYSLFFFKMILKRNNTRCVLLTLKKKCFTVFL